MPKTRVLLTIAFSLLAVTACGSDDSTSSSDTSSSDTSSSDTSSSDTSLTTDVADVADASAVGLKDSRFDPTDIEISAGETVTFTNNDPYSHTVTSADDSAIVFDSGEISQDVTFEQSFDTAGTYDFFCQIHPTMRGTVTVG